MTLDDISGGRLQIGIGAGGDGWDASALGQQDWTPPERADHFEEFIALLDRLLVQRETNHTGRFYSAKDARGLPGCLQEPRPPFIVAGAGPRGMKLVAEYGAGWVAVDGRDATEEKLARLADVCHAEGRDPASLSKTALLGFSETPMASLEAFRDCVGRYGEMGFSDVLVHWPRASEPFAADEGILDDIACDLEAANRSA
jgi:alkanesulfonate monooxygenase SsuD/methylene tetrahydromethanopterin reductase-like flavin-dependent oxidoreductase (luciferase family)